MPANKRYVHAYIELQCWPVQCHTIYTKYAHGMENCNQQPSGDDNIKRICKNVLCMQHQLEACTSDLGDDQSRYLFTNCYLCISVY